MINMPPNTNHDIQGRAPRSKRRVERAPCPDHGLSCSAPWRALDITPGQGPMCLEIIEQVPGLNAVIVSIGGAGLVAGLSLAVKTLKPNVSIIGVEPERAASYSAAVAAGAPVLIQMLPTLADGLA